MKNLKEVGSFLKISIVTVLFYVSTLLAASYFISDDFIRIVVIVAVNILSPLLYLFFSSIWQVMNNDINSKRVVEFLIFSLFVVGVTYISNKAHIEYELNDHVVSELSCEHLGGDKKMTCVEASYIEGVAGSEEEVRIINLVFNISIAVHQLIFGILASVSTGYIANYFFEKSKSKSELKVIKSESSFENHKEQIIKKVAQTEKSINDNLKILFFSMLGMLMLFFIINRLI